MPALAYRTTMPRPDDPEILESIYQDLIRGMPLRHAAVRAGISESTAYHWVMTGSGADGDPVLSDGELGSHALFVQTIKEANAACVDAELTAWDAGGKDWVAHATKLERRFPNDFGRNQRIDITSQHTEIHRIELGEATLAVLERIAELSSVDTKLIPASTSTD